MKKFLPLLLVVVLFACQKVDTTTFPVSDFSIVWIPANQDSVLFTSLWKDGTLPLLPDTNYLIYNDSQSVFNSQNPQLQTITQQGFCTDGSFLATFTLQAGIPEVSGTLLSKTDMLVITSAGTQNELYISKNAISGNFYFIDTMRVAERTYLNVLTDSTNYYFTQTDGIVAFNNGLKWFYKED